MKRLKLDAEEKEILRSVEAGEWKSVLFDKTESVHIQLPKKTLTKLKSLATKAGTAYQTLAASIIEQYTNKKSSSI